MRKVVLLGAIFALPTLARAGRRDAEVSIAPVQSTTATAHPGDLTALSLEELLEKEVTVTSVSKRPERLSNSPAAITVITNEDIRRSGVTNLPDALRLAPGVQVAQIDSSRFAVSIRGFNSSTANKLLVMIDGRIVYSPLFAQVYWNAQDVMLEDVDRIEVIRGPGATLWGSNAVNGVINIRTKSARDTQGQLFSALAGNYENDILAFRHGGRDKNVYYRVYGKTFKRDAFTDRLGRRSVDDWGMDRGGFRADWKRGERDSFTVQGDHYGADAGQVSAGLPGGADREKYSGTNLLGRWTRTYSPDRSLTVQAYYDRTDRSSSVFREARDNYDLEAIHTSKPSARQSLVLGATARRSADDIRVFTPSLLLDPSSAARDLFSVYALDEIDLCPDKFRLTLGTKFEHNDFSGWEVQPTVRSVYRLSEGRTIWSAASRAVRIPTRVDSDLQIILAGPGFETRLIGNKNFQAEVEESYEIGYRYQEQSSFSFDVTAFYADYSRLQTADALPRSFVGGRLLAPILLGNSGAATTHGVELATTWSPIDRWKLTAAYTTFDFESRIRQGSTAIAAPSAGEAPERQFQLRSFLNVTSELELDAMLYTVDGVTVPDYTRLDLRVGWHPKPDCELSFVTQNLLSGRHLEIAGASSTFIVPSTYGKLVCRF